MRYGMESSNADAILAAQLSLVADSENVPKEPVVAESQNVPKQSDDAKWQAKLATKDPAGPLVMKECGGGGDCMYKCISYAIHGNMSHHVEYRTMVCDWMEEHKNDDNALGGVMLRLKNFWLTKPDGIYHLQEGFGKGACTYTIQHIDEYIAHQRDHGYTTVDIELPILVNLLGIDSEVVVMPKTAKNLGLQMDASLMDELIQCEKRPAPGENPLPKVYLAADGGHFQVLLTKSQRDYIAPPHATIMDKFVGIELTEDDITPAYLLQLLYETGLWNCERLIYDNRHHFTEPEILGVTQEVTDDMSLCQQTRLIGDRKVEPVYTPPDTIVIQPGICHGVWPADKMDAPLYITPIHGIACKKLYPGARSIHVNASNDMSKHFTSFMEWCIIHREQRRKENSR